MSDQKTCGTPDVGLLMFEETDSRGDKLRVY